MDATSLGVGIGGLIGLFSTCVQSYELINLGASHGRDYQVLLTKLKIEKTRLISWGEAVGLYTIIDDCDDRQLELEMANSYHESLFRPHIQGTVFSILNCIQLTFTDVNRLVDRYGLEQDDKYDLVTSRNFMPAVSDGYQRFQRRMSMQQQRVGFFDKFRWCLKDKRKFDVLVSDLNGFNNSLIELVPDRIVNVRRLVKAEVDSLDDVHSLKLVEDAARDINADICEIASVRRELVENGELHTVPDDTRTICSSVLSEYFSALSYITAMEPIEPDSSDSRYQGSEDTTGESQNSLLQQSQSPVKHGNAHQQRTAVLPSGCSFQPWDIRQYAWGERLAPILAALRTAEEDRNIDYVLISNKRLAWELQKFRYRCF